GLPAFTEASAGPPAGEAGRDFFFGGRISIRRLFFSMPRSRNLNNALMISGFILEQNLFCCVMIYFHNLAL
ncbi:MAG: hypothetical protein Greene041639_348, partial [Parcubacteria group bacterium Greene0416_39]